MPGAWRAYAPPRFGSGSSGCAVAVSVRVSRGSGSADCWNASPFPGRGLWCGYGEDSHEAHQRRSRMVEISLSGSGEGLGRVIARGYSTGSTQPLTLGDSALSNVGEVGLFLEKYASEKQREQSSPWCDPGSRVLRLAPVIGRASARKKTPSRPQAKDGSATRDRPHGSDKKVLDMLPSTPISTVTFMHKLCAYGNILVFRTNTCAVLRGRSASCRLLLRTLPDFG